MHRLQNQVKDSHIRAILTLTGDRCGILGPRFIIQDRDWNQKEMGKSRKHCTAKECKRLLPQFLEMVKELRQSAFQSLRTLGNTLALPKGGILIKLV